MVLALQSVFGGIIMKQKLTPRLVIIKLTGILFAAYAAFIMFLIVRDGRMLPVKGIVIYALVALLFCALAGFCWTSEVKNIRFLIVRRIVFIIDLLAILFLKLRLVPGVIATLDYKNPQTLLYGGVHFLTLGALIILIVYFVLVLKNLPRHLIASVILPLLTIALLLGGLVLEIILFCKYGIGLEGNTLRTVTSRPVFYLSFIGLSVYFLFPPQMPKQPDGMRVSKADDRDFVI